MRHSSISIVNFVFVYIVIQNQKNFADLMKKNSWVFKFYGNEFCWMLILKFWLSINLLLGHESSHKKIWAGSVQPYRFSRFDICWIQTNKKQKNNVVIYRYWDFRTLPAHLLFKLWTFSLWKQIKYWFYKKNDSWIFNI